MSTSQRARLNKDRRPSQPSTTQSSTSKDSCSPAPTSTTTRHPRPSHNTRNQQAHAHPRDRNLPMPHAPHPHAGHRTQQASKPPLAPNSTALQDRALPSNSLPVCSHFCVQATTARSTYATQFPLHIQQRHIAHRHPKTRHRNPAQEHRSTQSKSPATIAASQRSLRVISNTNPAST